MISFPYVYESSGAGVTFDSSGLCQYPATVVIPNTVTNITNSVRGFNGHTEIEHVLFEEGSTLASAAPNAFQGCANLESIDLPDTLTGISNFMFSNCGSLSEVGLPSALASIGSSAFAGTAIEELELPETVTTLSPSAFATCRSLASISLPGRITTLPANCFDSCLALSGIVIPASVTAINSNCFYGSGLNSITIPATVTTLQNGVFRNCTSLRNVRLEGTPTCSYYAVNNANNPFHGCTALEAVQLPPGWTENLLLSFSNNLTHDSLIAMIANLYDYSGGTAHTLTIGAANLARLSSAEIAAAADKNWTIA